MFLKKKKKNICFLWSFILFAHFLKKGKEIWIVSYQSGFLIKIGGPEYRSEQKSADRKPEHWTNNQKRQKVEKKKNVINENFVVLVGAALWIIQIFITAKKKIRNFVLQSTFLIIHQ